MKIITGFEEKRNQLSHDWGNLFYNTFVILPYLCMYILCSTTSVTQLATSTSAAAASPPLTAQPSSSDITTTTEPRMATAQLFFTADEVGLVLRRLCPDVPGF